MPSIGLGSDSSQVENAVFSSTKLLRWLEPSDNVKIPSESPFLRPPLEQALPSTALQQDHERHDVPLHPGHPPLTNGGTLVEQLKEISYDSARYEPFSCLLRATGDVTMRQTSWDRAHVVLVKTFL